jgi:hypothetical protein
MDLYEMCWMCCEYMHCRRPPHIGEENTEHHRPAGMVSLVRKHESTLTQINHTLRNAKIKKRAPSVVDELISNV